MATSLEFLNANDQDRGSLIPTKILEQNLMSPTSEAYRCFVHQAFSANLQAYMINYVISISGNQSVYA
jgi:hypothetical protein